MPKLRVRFVSSFLTFVRYLAISGFAFSFLALACVAHGQVESGDSIVWFHLNEEVRVANLSSLTAASTDTPAVLTTALETVLHDKAVCCGKNSALEDAVLAEPRTLKDLGTRVQGRHFLSDGRPILVSADYVPQSSIGIGPMIGALQDQHAQLIEWKSNVYVLYGALYSETRYQSGRREYAVRKLFLLDPRFSDQRREVELNRDADDWGEVEGLLTVTVKSQ